MTSNFNSPWTKVFELPELLAPIGSFLDPPDLLSCVQICRHWNQLFIPALWRTINDRLYSWPKIIEDLSVNPQDEGIKDETWFRDIYSKYGHHIRFLCADSVITILAAQVSGQCVNLRTLSVSRIGSKHFVEEARTLVERIQGNNASLLENEKKDGLSKNLISPLFSESIHLPFGLQALETCQRWIFAQRFWLLVSQNPLLQGLQLGSTLQGPCVPLESELIYRILASLPLLTTFECDMSRKVFDLQLILENIPQVRHFASSIRPPGRPALTKSFPQIQTLYLNLAFAIPDFFSLLIRLPNLEVLRIKALCYVDFFAGVPETLMDNTPSSLRELHFFDTNPAVIKYLDRALADLVLPWLPHLTDLTLRRLEPRTAAILGTCCPKLQAFRLATDDGDTIHARGFASWCDVNIMGVLLRTCPYLKVIDGILHAIEAEYLLDEPWVCRGLETLRCQIVGMGRLTDKEQDIYNSWMASTARVDVDEGCMVMEEQDVAKVMEIVDKHRRCQQLHGQVYDRLVEMTQLRVLDVGYEYNNQWEMFEDNVNVCEIDGRLYSAFSRPIPNTLELSLESGLSRLGALRNLEVFGFEGTDHRIGEKELDWVATSWPRLRIMRGLQEPIFSMVHDPKSMMLKKHMEGLRPLVKHEAVQEESHFLKRPFYPF